MYRPCVEANVLSPEILANTHSIVVLRNRYLSKHTLHVPGQRTCFSLYRKDCCPLVCKEWAQLLRAPSVWNQVVLEPSLASGSRLIAEMMADWLRVRSTVCFPSLLFTNSVGCYLYESLHASTISMLSKSSHTGYQRPPCSSV